MNSSIRSCLTRLHEALDAAAVESYDDLAEATAAAVRADVKAWDMSSELGKIQATTGLLLGDSPNVSLADWLKRSLGDEQTMRATTRARKNLYVAIGIWVRKFIQPCEQYTSELVSLLAGTLRKEKHAVSEQPAFIPLEQLLDSTIFDSASLSNANVGKLLRELNSSLLENPNRKSARVKGSMFSLAGRLMSRYPAPFKLNLDYHRSLGARFKSASVDVLKENVSKSKTKPEPTLMAGALMCLRLCLTKKEDEETKKTLWRVLKKLIVIHPELARFDVPKEAMWLLMTHSELFSRELAFGKDTLTVYEQLCANVACLQAKVRKAAVPCLSAVTETVAKACDVALKTNKHDEVSASQRVKVFAAKFNKIIDNDEKYESWEILHAVEGLGLFASSVYAVKTDDRDAHMRDRLSKLFQLQDRVKVKGSSSDWIAKSDGNVEIKADGYFKGLGAGDGAPTLRIAGDEMSFEDVDADAAEYVVGRTTSSGEVYRRAVFALSTARVASALDKSMLDARDSFVTVSQLASSAIKLFETYPTCKYESDRSTVRDALLAMMCRFAHWPEILTALVGEVVPNAMRSLLTANDVDPRSTAKLWCALCSSPRDDVDDRRSNTTTSIWKELLRFVLDVVPSLDLERIPSESGEIRTLSTPDNRLLASDPENYAFFENLVETLEHTFKNVSWSYTDAYKFSHEFELELLLVAEEVNRSYPLTPRTFDLATTLFDLMKRFRNGQRSKRAHQAAVRLVERGVLRLSQYSDSTLHACCVCLLSVPDDLFRNERELFKSVCGSAVPRALAVARSGFSELGDASLRALERWNCDETLRPNLVQKLVDVLPSLSDFLTESDDRAFELRVAKFVGSLGSDSHFLLRSKSEVLERAIGWSADPKLSLRVRPCDATLDLKLHEVYTQVLRCATSAVDRETKVAACETLHACVLFAVGDSKFGSRDAPSRRGKNELFEKTLPMLINLGVDEDATVRELFEPLSLQLARWFAHSDQCVAEHRDLLLSAAMEGVQSKDNALKRSLSSRVLGELVRWSHKTALRSHSERSSMRDVFRRVSTMCRHPSPFKRLGACFAFEAVKKHFREDSIAVSDMILDVLDAFTANARRCDADPPELDTAQAISKAFSSVARILTAESTIQVLRTPSSRRTGRSATLKEACAELARTAVSRSRIARRLCRDLLKALPKAESDLGGLDPIAILFHQDPDFRNCTTLRKVFELQPDSFHVAPLLSDVLTKEHFEPRVEDVKAWLFNLEAACDGIQWLKLRAPHLSDLSKAEDAVWSRLSTVIAERSFFDLKLISVEHLERLNILEPFCRLVCSGARLFFASAPGGGGSGVRRDVYESLIKYLMVLCGSYQDFSVSKYDPQTHEALFHSLGFCFGRETKPAGYHYVNCLLCLGDSFRCGISPNRKWRMERVYSYLVDQGFTFEGVLNANLEDVHKAISQHSELSSHPVRMRKSVEDIIRLMASLPRSEGSPVDGLSLLLAFRFDIVLSYKAVVFGELIRSARIGDYVHSLLNRYTWSDPPSEVFSIVTAAAFSVGRIYNDSCGQFGSEQRIFLTRIKDQLLVLLETAIPTARPGSLRSTQLVGPPQANIAKRRRTAAPLTVSKGRVLTELFGAMCALEDDLLRSVLSTETVVWLLESLLGVKNVENHVNVIECLPFLLLNTALGRNFLADAPVRSIDFLNERNDYQKYERDAFFQRLDQDSSLLKPIRKFVVVEQFPISSRELENHERMDDFRQLLFALLGAFESSGSPALLIMLAEHTSVLVEGPEHLFFDRICDALANVANRADISQTDDKEIGFCPALLLISQFVSISNCAVSKIVYERLIRPLCRRLFERHWVYLLCCMPSPDTNSERFGAYLLRKISADVKDARSFELLSLFFERCGPEAVQVVSRSLFNEVASAKGNALTVAAFTHSLAVLNGVGRVVSSPSSSSDAVDSLDRYVDNSLAVSAYACSVACVCRTQTKPKFFKKIPVDIFSKIVSNTRPLAPTSEYFSTEHRFLDVSSQLTASDSMRESLAKVSDARLFFVKASTQGYAPMGLTQDAAAGGDHDARRPHEEEEFIINRIPGHGVNRHPSMPFAIAFLDVYTQLEGDEDSQRPFWVEAVASGLKVGSNVGLFCASLIANRATLFEPHAAYLVPTILEFWIELETPKLELVNRIDKRNVRGIHYGLSETINLIFGEWKRDWSSSATDQVRSRFCDIFMYGLASTRLLNRNLESFHAVIKSLRPCSVDLRYVAELVACGVNERSRREFGDNPEAQHVYNICGKMKRIGLNVFVALAGTVPLEAWENVDGVSLEKFSELIEHSLKFRRREVADVGVRAICAMVEKFPSFAPETKRRVSELILEYQRDQQSVVRSVEVLFEFCQAGFADFALENNRIVAKNLMEEIPALHAEILGKALRVAREVFRLASDDDDELFVSREAVAASVCAVLTPRAFSLDLDQPIVVEHACEYVFECVKRSDDFHAESRWWEAIAELAVSHPNPESRVYALGCLAKKMTDSSFVRDDDVSKTCERALFVGLADPDHSADCFDYFHTVRLTSSSVTDRLDETLSLLATFDDSAVFKHQAKFSSHVARLLLAMCTRASDYESSKLFSAPLTAEVLFKHADIETSLVTTQPSTAAAAAATQFVVKRSHKGDASRASQVKRSVVEARNLQGLVRATQASLAFASTQQDAARFLAPSTQGTAPLSAPSSSQQQQQQQQRERGAQSSKVALVRQYRVGDVPDVEIKTKDVLEPLLKLCGRDDAVAAVVLSSIVDAWSVATKTGTEITSSCGDADAAHARMHSQFARALDGASHPQLVEALHASWGRLGTEFSVQDVSIVERSVDRSSSSASGVVLLESLPNNVDCAKALQGMYQALDEWDVALGIADTREDMPARGALRALVRGDPKSAADEFLERLKSHPNDLELRKGCIDAFKQLGDWKSVSDCAADGMSDAEELSDPWTKPFVEAVAYDRWADVAKSVYTKKVYAAKRKAFDHVENLKVAFDHLFARSAYSRDAAPSSLRASCGPELALVQCDKALRSDDATFDIDAVRGRIVDALETSLEKWRALPDSAVASRRRVIEDLRIISDCDSFVETFSRAERARKRAEAARCSGIVKTEALSVKEFERLATSAWEIPSRGDSAELRLKVCSARLLLFQVGLARFAEDSSRVSLEASKLLGSHLSMLAACTIEFLCERGQTDAALFPLKTMNYLMRSVPDTHRPERLIESVTAAAARVSRAKACGSLESLESYIEKFKKDRERLPSNVFDDLMADLHADASEWESGNEHRELALDSYHSLCEAYSSSSSSSKDYGKALLKLANFCDSCLRASSDDDAEEPPFFGMSQKFCNTLVKAFSAGFVDESMVGRMLSIVSSSSHVVSGRKVLDSIDAGKAVSCSEVFKAWIPQLVSLQNSAPDFALPLLTRIASEKAWIVRAPYAVWKSANPGFHLNEPSRFRLHEYLMDSTFDRFVLALEFLTPPWVRLEDCVSRMARMDTNQEKLSYFFDALVVKCLEFEGHRHPLGTRIGASNREFARYVCSKSFGFGNDFASKTEVSEITDSLLSDLKKHADDWKNANDVADIDSRARVATARSRPSSLSKACEWLSDFDSNEHASSLKLSDTTEIAGFNDEIVSMKTLRSPKRIIAVTAEASEKRLLVKSGDDLRLDARVQHVFERVNKLVESHEPELSGISTYDVFPLGINFGAIEWIDKTTTLMDAVNYQLKLDGIDVAVASANNLVGTLKLKSLDERGYAEAFQNPEAYVRKFQQAEDAVPDNVLRRKLLSGCASPQAYVALRVHFVKSLALLSATSYVLGIGDRHLENLMIKESEGALVGIDFGHAFSRGVVNNPIPDLVPFRLTKQLRNVLRPLDTGDGSNGLFRHSMAKALRMLRNCKHDLFSVLEACLREPGLFMNAASVRTTDGRLSGSMSPVEALLADVLQRKKKDFKITTEMISNVVKKCQSKNEQRTVDTDAFELVSLATSKEILALTWAGFCPHV